MKKASWSKEDFIDVKSVVITTSRNKKFRYGINELFDREFTTSDGGSITYSQIASCDYDMELIYPTKLKAYLISNYKGSINE